MLAKQAIAREEVPCSQWKPSRQLVRDVMSGQCHQRYLEREMKRNEGGVATLHAGAEVASDDEAEDSPIHFYFYFILQFRDPIYRKSMKIL